MIQDWLELAAFVLFALSVFVLPAVLIYWVISGRYKDDENGEK